MRSLYENAIDAIQVGVEDYQANDPRRATSAVRNFYAGTLLLAKEALRRAAPDADPDLIIAARVKLVPDGDGGVEALPADKNTLDFSTIGVRLKDFGIPVDMAALRDLNRIRTDIEHAANPHAEDAVREAIASSFPVVAQLFEAMETQPAAELGDETWSAMLAVKKMYDLQLQQCEATFAGIKWTSDVLSNLPRLCPSCGSRLVEMTATWRDDFQSMQCQCRQCGEATSAETVIPHSLEELYANELYIAAKDGDMTPLHDCPECSLTTYLTTEEHTGCVWCELQLGECLVCSVPLSPENVDWDNHNLCSYHGDVMSKDD